jgi:hypothetical protein
MNTFETPTPTAVQGVVDEVLRTCTRACKIQEEVIEILLEGLRTINSNKTATNEKLRQTARNYLAREKVRGYLYARYKKANGETRARHQDTN